MTRSTPQQSTSTSSRPAQRPAGVPLGVDEESTEARREIIEVVSPEGRPGDPNFGSRQLGMMLVAIVVGMLVVALVLALLTQTVLAIAVGVIGILLFVVNPEIWAAILRTRERHKYAPKQEPPDRA
ncbi:MAG: hypothetical protein R3B68_07435 [Phycisphaerales bacterium]